MIDLDAKGVEGSAESAAHALEQLKASIKGDTQEIAAMQRALKNLEGGTKVSIKEVYKLKDSIAAKKASLAESQSSFVKLGGSFKSAAKSAKEPRDAIGALQSKLDGMRKRSGVDVGGKSLEALGQQASKLPGPLGDMLGKLTEVKTLIAGGDLGFLAIAGGLAALVAATVAAIGKLTEYGIAQGDARRSELLRIEGLTKTRFWYGAAAGSAKDMQAAIDRVAASSAASRSDIAQYSDQLYRMGLRGQNLSDALEGVAIKSTVQGQAAANAFAGWAAGAALTGQSVKRLTDDVKNRLGGVAQKQLASLSVQALKSKESMDALFNGIDVERFVTAKKTVNDLLSQTTNSGRAIKALLTSLVQPIVDMAAKAQPILKRFFQGMIEEALILHIQWLQLKIAFKKTFAQPDVLQGVDKMNAALVTGKVVMWSLAAALAFAAGSMIALTWPVLLAGAALWGLWEIVTDLYQLWDELDWKAIGTGMLQGIIDGFNGDVLVQAIKGELNAVVDAAKNLLGIHSPSTVFARIGFAIPEGFAAGVDAGAPTARSAVNDMVDVPRMPAGERAPDAAARPPVAGPTGAAGAVVNIGDIYVNSKASDAKGLAADFKREIERVLEGVAIQLGAPNVGEPA